MSLRFNIDNYCTIPTAITLHTGGKGVVQRQSLFCLTASMTDMIADQSIPPEKIELGSLGALGADYKRWKVLPDNQNIDVTPKKVAPLQCFGPDGSGISRGFVGPGKYPLTIKANGDLLCPDCEVPIFFISQKISLTQDFPTPYVTLTSLWTLGGTYVNDKAQPFPMGSVNYFQNDSMLTNFNTVAWWWKPGEKVDISLTDTATFSNGQSTTVTASGRITLLKPAVTMTATVTGQIRGDYNYLPYLGKPYLHFGGYNDPNNIFNFIQGIVFDYNLNGSHFTNPQQQFSFLRTGTAHRVTTSTTGTNYFIDSTGYDTQTPTHPEGDSPAQPASLSDSQSNLIPVASISSSDSYIEYLMFQYDADSIPVPLQLINWNWGGRASAANNWQAESPQYPGNLTPNDNPGFPVWTNRLDAQTGTSHQP